MKEIGKERKIAIAALIVAVLMLTVAFAAMSRTLKINGTAKVDSAAWDIHFKSAEMKDKKGDAREVAGPVISEDGIDLTLKVGLRKPKDEITYEAVIENSGDIDAEIESIEYPTLTDDQAKIIEFVATYQNGDEISKSQELKAGSEKTVKIVIRYKDITDESLLATNAYDVPLTFKINYIQKGQSISFDTESTPEGGEIVDTETSPFKVTKDGVLIHYERQGDETSITVPAEVNGIKIKEVAPFVFVDFDMIIADVNDDSAIIIVNEEKEDEIRQLALKEEINFVAKVSEFGNNNDPFSLDSLDFNAFVYNNGDFEDIPATNYYLSSLDLSNMIYLEKIADGAFMGLLGEGEEECGTSGLCSLGNLTDLKLPKNGILTDIGSNAFDSNKISELVIPASVTRIGSEAFQHNNLTTVTVLGEPTDRFDSNWSDIFDSDVTRN